jgi:hypothetical protein
LFDPVKAHGVKSHSKSKVEQDVHCSHANVAYSATYFPVPEGLSISRLSKVADDYYPELPRLLGVPPAAGGSARISPDPVLPLHHVFARTKSVVAGVRVGGLPAVLALVVEYGSEADAYAGHRGRKAELSIRIKRADGDDAAVSRALGDAAWLADSFKALGWDEPAAGGVELF